MLVKLSSIKPNPDNPRTISKDQFAKLKKSIEDFPEMLKLTPLVVDENNVVLSGNMRLKALSDLGYKEVEVIKAKDLTEEQKREFVIKANLPFGEWDWDLLANKWNLDSLQGYGLIIPGFAIQPPGIEDDGFEIPKEVKTDIVFGDLFEIGRHRLLCGSSTEKADVEKLLRGQEPYLMVTDPPYGVNYNPAWRNEYCMKHGLAVPNRATGKVENDDIADWTIAYALSPAAVAYVWHAGVYAAIVSEGLLRAKYEMRAQIIWRKQHFVFGRGNYHWQHEPCWYAVKKGFKGNWAGDRKQTTVWDIQNKNPMGGKKEDTNTSHGTQKPVECMAIPIRNHDGDVHDPFLGSGTTMVAAHQLDRKCYGMELSPEYCQIIVDRMKKLDPNLEIKKNGVLI